MAVLDSVRKMDYFPKTLNEFKVKTRSGAIMTLLTVIFIVYLSTLEFIRYFSPDKNISMYVDNDPNSKIYLKIDIFFPRIPCSLLTISHHDTLGHSKFSIYTNINLLRYNENGEFIDSFKNVKLDELYSPNTTVSNSTDLSNNITNLYNNTSDISKVGGECMSCYGSREGCCNSCEDLKEAYHRRGWYFDPHGIPQCEGQYLVDMLKDYKNEGCRVDGSLILDKVKGYINIGPGKSFGYYINKQELYNKTNFNFNTSHSVRYFYFGARTSDLTRPMEGIEEISTELNMYQYFIKVIPTKIIRSTDPTIETNQYSLTSHKRILSDYSKFVPGVYLIYDISSLGVSYSYLGEGFFHFLTSLCAIFGGVITVMGLIDSFIYNIQLGYRAARLKK